MDPVYHQLPLFPFEKTCSTCGQTKPLTAFHADKSKPDGLHTTCKECKLAWFRVRQESSPAYRQANKERAAEWRKKNPTAWETWAQPRIEEIRARHREWTRTHPEQCTAYNRRRQAREKASAGEPIDYKAILARDGYWCHICQQPVDPPDVGFDHVVPLARCGAHTAENIKICHRRCNQRKHTRLTDWLR